MKFFASVLLFSLISSNLVAQTDPPATPQGEKAKIVLEAPSTARVGELIRFDVSQSIADSFQWLLVPESAKADFETYNAGSRAVFSARGPGEYVFIVACAKNGTVDVVRHVITVKSPPQTPTNDSLEAWIPFWAYTYNLPPTECHLLANSFEKVASNPNLETPGDWIKATSESNRAILGSKLDLFKPLLNKIGKILQKRAQDGLLVTPEQHKALWLEIASALRKI